MTSRSKESKAEKSFNDHQSLSRLRKTDSYLFVSQGAVLHKLRNDEVYKLTNGGMSWEDYLRQPEVSLTTGQARQMIEAHLLFVQQMGLTPEEIGQYPLPALKFILNKYKKGQFQSYSEIQAVLAASTELSFRDLKEFYHDAKKEGLEEEKRTYEFVIMKRCIETNNLTKVHDITSEEIKKAFNLNEI